MPNWSTPSPGATPYSNPATIKDIEVVFARVVNVVLGLAGIAFFIMLLVGGFNMLTSGGEPQKADAAKKTLTTAFAGLMLVALAYLIIKFLSNFTGLPLGTFSITLPTPAP